MKIILDFTSHKYASEIYKTIKNSFDLPQEYGENLSALWDSLDGWCSQELYVYIKGLDTLSEELRDYMGEILDVFADVHKANPNMNFIVVS